MAALAVVRGTAPLDGVTPPSPQRQAQRRRHRDRRHKGHHRQRDPAQAQDDDRGRPGERRGPRPLQPGPAMSTTTNPASSAGASSATTGLAAAAWQSLRRTLLTAREQAELPAVFPLRRQPATAGLRGLPHALALRAGELLARTPPERVRGCAGPGRGWFFLDRTRAGTRRWCSSDGCGNRDRVRRHYARTHASGGTSSTGPGSWAPPARPAAMPLMRRPPRPWPCGKSGAGRRPRRRGLPRG